MFVGNKQSGQKFGGRKWTHSEALTARASVDSSFNEFGSVSIDFSGSTEPPPDPANKRTCLVVLLSSFLRCVIR